MTIHQDLLAPRLTCHPATPAGTPMSLTAQVGMHAEGLSLIYTLECHTDRLLIPPDISPGPADGLWQHTCFEAFVAADDTAAYREFNFSPSGQWACYGFAAERQRDDPIAPPAPAPRLQLTTTPTQLTLRVHLPARALPSPAHHLDLALCAVIEEHDGRLSYWALHHPQAMPDFHHPAGRALRLARHTL